jgi:hypothetical protein
MKNTGKVTEEYKFTVMAFEKYGTSNSADAGPALCTS